MKTIKLENRTVEVSTSLNEIGIDQFEKCVNILKTTYESSIDQYVDLIQALSTLTRDEIEDLDLSEFESLIKAIKIDDMTGFADKYINEIEVNGVKYRTKSNGETFKFSVKEMFLLQDKIKQNEEKYISDLCAIIFREVDADGNISNDLSNEAINKRKEALKDIKMNIIAPYLIVLSKYFLDKQNEYGKQATK